MFLSETDRGSLEWQPGQAWTSGAPSPAGAWGPPWARAAWLSDGWNPGPGRWARLALVQGHVVPSRASDAPWSREGTSGRGGGGSPSRCRKAAPGGVHRGPEETWGEWEPATFDLQAPQARTNLATALRAQEVGRRGVARSRGRPQQCPVSNTAPLPPPDPPTLSCAHLLPAGEPAGNLGVREASGAAAPPAPPGCNGWVMRMGGGRGGRCHRRWHGGC